MSSVSICTRRAGNQYTLRAVSALFWRVASFTGLATRLGACALTATAPNACQRLQRSGDGRTCLCQPGYTGTNCEININECAANPCKNNGTCTDSINRYTCSCQPGYSGTNCDTNINECASNPCQNNGTCTDGINNYTCRCQPGYNGTTCENSKSAPGPPAARAPRVPVLESACAALCALAAD